MTGQAMIYHFYGVLVGAALGSFANVCIYRVPRGRSVVRPRSRCPRCARMIPWRENLPVLSFVFLKGRCAGCRRSISWRYPAVESLMAALFLFVTLREPPGLGAVLGAALAFVLVVISVIDLDWRIIPDVFSLGLVGVGLILAPLNSFLGDAPSTRAAAALLGAGTGYLSAWALSVGGRRFFKREALGGGDVKLLAGLGAFLGWRGVADTWFLASLLGTLLFVALKLRRRLDWGEYLPFGPFLAAGAWIHWTWPTLSSLWWGR